MLVLSCQSCRHTVRESHSSWDQVANTHRCPECGAFYDAATEGEAVALSCTPEVVGHVRRLRMWAVFGLALGVVLVVATSVIGLVLGLRVGLIVAGGFALPLFGQSISMLVRTPLKVARLRVSRPAAKIESFARDEAT